MQLVHVCPVCSNQNRQEVDHTTQYVKCAHCDWSRDFPPSDFLEGSPKCCLACGCGDLWKQKDFPPQIGLTFVALGAISSTWFWANREPTWAIGVLMAFALIDLLLYAFMRDVLVCYSCGARHRRADIKEEHSRFNLEVAERYRQEAIRLEESQKQ